MPETVNIPGRLYRAGPITSARMEGEEETSRRVSLTFSSEAEVLRGWGVEILGHGAGEVDASRAEAGAVPLLIDHRADLEHQVGRVVSVEIKDGRGHAVAEFGAHPRAREYLERVRAGEVRDVSVGYAINALLQIDVREGVPVYRATSWTIHEISLVAVAADTGVGIGRSAEADPVSVNLEIRMSNATTTPETETKPAAEPKPSARSAAAPAPAPKPEPKPAEARHEDCMTAERARIADITATARQFGISAEATDKAVREGTSVADFQREVLAQIGARQDTSLAAGSARIGLTEREVKRFSFAKAIRYLANRDDKKARDAAGFEIECSRAAEDHYGRAATGLMLPADVMGGESYGSNHGTRASDMVADTATAGGNMVDDILMAGSFIDLLRNTAIMPRLGARILGGLQGDISIPKQTGAATAYWLGEDGEPTNSGLTIGQVKMTPHTVGAVTQISRKLLLQSSVGVEALVRADIARVIALAIDHAALNGNADADAPDGLVDIWSAGGSAVNGVDFAAAGAPTYAEVVAMWTAISQDNADMGGMGFALNPAQVAHCMTTPKFGAGTSAPIMENKDSLAGYRAERSNQVSAGEMWFGNWNDFVIGLWSGLDLTVNPYSQAKSGAIEVIALQDVDFAVRNEESFCLGSAAVTP